MSSAATYGLHAEAALLGLLPPPMAPLPLGNELRAKRARVRHRGSGCTESLGTTLILVETHHYPEGQPTYALSKIRATHPKSYITRGVK